MRVGAAWGRAVAQPAALRAGADGPSDLDRVEGCHIWEQVQLSAGHCTQVACGVARGGMSASSKATVARLRL